MLGKAFFVSVATVSDPFAVAEGVKNGWLSGLFQSPIRIEKTSTNFVAHPWADMYSSRPVVQPAPWPCPDSFLDSKSISLSELLEH